ncbi:MAG: DUF31 family protein [Mycoplasmataceae bacterium]|nr:DUF31 family protein [Mycoplasmataceae bacterium]
MIIKLIFVSLTFIPFANSNILIEKKKSEIKEEKTYSDNELYQFIFDRTFSLGGNNSHSGKVEVVGTGWLFKHISDYKYLMFTNWHVADAMKAQVGYSYYGSENYPTTPSAINNNYLLFYETPRWKNASYEIEGEVELGVDISLLEVEFINPTSGGTLRNRLNKLNNYANTHDGYLFNGYVDYNDISINDEIYVAGYPLVTIDYTDDNNGIISGSRYTNPTFYYGKDKIIEKGRGSHLIDENGKIRSLGYGFQTEGITTYMNNMGGGCSGSVAIDKKMNIVGILWGGAKYNSYPLHAYESFSHPADGFLQTNSTLYEDYLNNKWISVRKEKTINYSFIILLTSISLIIAGLICTFAITSFKNKKRKIQN